MSGEDTAKQIYDEAVVIDALNVSNWESPAVYQSLHTGGITAINATSAVWGKLSAGDGQYSSMAASVQRIP